MTQIISSLSSTNTRNYLNDYKLLASVNDIFTILDKEKKILLDLTFDLSLLESDIYSNLANFDEEKTQDINARLAVWRQVLEKFDSETSVSKLRLLFEEANSPSVIPLEHLLTFYLTKTSRSTEDRDKTDLVVTRLGRMAFQTRESETFLLPPPELKNHLENIFTTFHLQTLTEDKLTATVSLIAEERKRLLTIRSLREMLEKQVLLKLRKIKNDLGESFFQPIVLTEIVALNVSLHNVFQDLFLAEQSRLTSFLSQQESGGIQRITAADQALASVIERPHKDEVVNIPSVQVSLDANEIMEIIQGMRDILLMLDKQLQLLSEKVSINNS